MAEHVIGDTLSPRDKKDYIKSTDIECPTCKKENLHVKSDLEDTVQLECPNCLYIENKPSEFVKELTDIRGRPLKPPQS